MRSGFGKTSSHSYPSALQLPVPKHDRPLHTPARLDWSPDARTPRAVAAACGLRRQPAAGPSSPLARSRPVPAPRYPCQANSFTGAATIACAQRPGRIRSLLPPPPATQFPPPAPFLLRQNASTRGWTVFQIPSTPGTFLFFSSPST